jgi:hypothetical protein
MAPIPEKEGIKMLKSTIRHPITQEVLPLIMEEGQPKRLILTMEQFRMIADALKSAETGDIEEARWLSESSVFRQLVEQGLKQVKEGKTRPWRKFLAEL